MGVNVSSIPKPDIDRHRSIEKAIKDDKKKNLYIFKLLLLGTGDSGKSTIVKQMRILYTDGFKSDEIEKQRLQIFYNIYESITAIIRAMKTLSIKFDEPSSEIKAGVILNIEQSWLCGHNVTDDEWSCIKDLWADAGVQECFARANEYQLADSTKYFLNDLERISSPTFIPTQDDILRTRVSTVGVVEISYPYRNRTLNVIDVGGQRAQRRKWIHCFEGVNSLIYVASLSEYNEVLLEDSHTNRMVEALKLFKTICNCQWFKTTPVILFLNKKDIFAEKIKIFPLTSTFPEYTGDQTYEGAVDFIQKEYEQRKPNNKEDLYVHKTCATDTQNVQFVIDAAFAIVMVRNMKDTGIA